MNKLLIYGPRKAGTTLLQNLLDGHSKIFMVPGELKLKHLYTKVLFSGMEKYEYFFQRGRSLYVDYMKYDKATHGLHFTSPADFLKIDPQVFRKKFDCERFTTLCNQLQFKDSRNFKQLIQKDFENHLEASVFKDTGVTFQASKEVGGEAMSIISFFKAMFPESHVVFIARKPKYVVSSIIRDRKRKKIRLSYIDIVKECQKVSRILHIFGTKEFMHQERTAMVFYEELVKNTQKAMTRLCTSLGIEYESINARPTVLGAPCVVRTSSLQTNEVFDTSTRDWKKGLTLREIWVVASYFSIYKKIYPERNLYENLKDLHG